MHITGKCGTSPFGLHYRSISDSILDLMLDLNFGFDFVAYLGLSFWIDFGPRTSQNEGATRNYPKINLMAWNVCHFGFFLISFWMHFGKCLDRLEIIKTCIFSKHRAINVTPVLIIVTFWCGSHFGLNLNYILEPFWHHSGVPFWFHFGWNRILNGRCKFWIHFGIIFGVPKSSKNQSKNNSQNRSQNRSPNDVKNM